VGRSRPPKSLSDARRRHLLACSFWLADNLVMVGRTNEARRLFEHLLSLRNDVGLLAEQYDPAHRCQLGNFPQAFSHVGLVNTAHNLMQAVGRRPRAPKTEAPVPLGAVHETSRRLAIWQNPH
jgi:GH15 family glucan-1,4-alpha-glucosidase